MPNDRTIRVRSTSSANEPARTIGVRSTTTTEPARTIRVETSTSDERAVAIHEAGHAVAHLRLGIEQEYLTIVPKDGNEGASFAVARRDHSGDERSASAVKRNTTAIRIRCHRACVDLELANSIREPKWGGHRPTAGSTTRQCW